MAGRIIAVVVVAIGLQGCSLLDGELFSESFWGTSPLKQNINAELGIAELAKGNFVTAEGYFRKALKSNPRDIDALIGAAILYQNTGQQTKARQMYEAVLALRPDESHQFVVWNEITTRPASQIASVNLSLLDSGKVPSQMQSGAAPLAATLRKSVTGAPVSSALLGRTAQSPTTGPVRALMANGQHAALGSYSGPEMNVTSRFATLRALRDQGLVTPAEFAQRRQTNIGALLPLTSPPPASGLDRSVPTSEQISGRLRAIGRGLEMRAISVSQHAAERSMIIDALMPGAPVVVANPAPPPRGLMEAADAVRRLEQLQKDGYIRSDEYARERQAIELAMRPTSPSPQAIEANSVAKVEPKEMKANPKTRPSQAVHLASYRSMKRAVQSWAKMKKAHKAVLGGLQHEISKVNLGKKGTYYRLKAGPFDSKRAAKSACGKLKRRRQFCEPSMMYAG
jgi:hypothetical protein